MSIFDEEYFTISVVRLLMVTVSNGCAVKYLRVPIFFHNISVFAAPMKNKNKHVYEFVVVFVNQKNCLNLFHNY